MYSIVEYMKQEGIHILRSLVSGGRVVPQYSQSLGTGWSRQEVAWKDEWGVGTSVFGTDPIPCGGEVMCDVGGDRFVSVWGKMKGSDGWCACIFATSAPLCVINVSLVCSRHLLYRK